ncbi:MAG: hypothetical protein IPM55_18050 [Acidobacteria bacterium]|nr:hypothetical protein [Acidobacteriota bacterium]
MNERLKENVAQPAEVVLTASRGSGKRGDSPNRPDLLSATSAGCATG